VGGAERQRVLLANGLADLGHEVTFVALQDLGPLSDFLDPAVEIWRTRPVTGRLPRRHDVVVTGITNTEAAFSVAARVRRPRLRWLAVAHSWPTEGTPLYAWPLRRVLRTASAVAGLTPRHVQALRASEGWRRELEVLPNGTDVALGGTPEPSRTTRLGFVGRLEAVKGADRLLSALADLPPEVAWSLAVYGEGSQRAGLEAFARARSLPVVWRGWASDITAAFAELDLLVVPSRSEAVPMVVLEALSFGLPVIAAGVGALPDILEWGDALLDDDESTWSGHLATLVQDEDLRSRLRENGLAAADRWRLPAMVERYDALLRRLVAKPAGEVGTSRGPSVASER
jgi:glycosyltransferase involved in cell wall biosynthesis